MITLHEKDIEVEIRDVDLKLNKEWGLTLKNEKNCIIDAYFIHL